MISMDDCLGFCDAEPDDIDRVARSEHLPPILAAMKAHAETHHHSTIGSSSGAETARRSGRRGLWGPVWR